MQSYHIMSAVFHGSIKCSILILTPTVCELAREIVKKAPKKNLTFKTSLN